MLTSPPEVESEGFLPFAETNLHPNHYDSQLNRAFMFNNRVRFKIRFHFNFQKYFI